jgi:hypothetical protein
MNHNPRGGSADPLVSLRRMRQRRNEDDAAFMTRTTEHWISHRQSELEAKLARHRAMMPDGTDADRRDFPDPTTRRRVLRQLEANWETELRMLKEVPTDPLARVRWLGGICTAMSECFAELVAEMEEHIKRRGSPGATET